MLQKILMKTLQVFLSCVVAFAVDYGFAEVTAEYVQQMPSHVKGIMLIILAGLSGYGMYKLLGRLDRRIRGEYW